MADDGGNTAAPGKQNDGVKRGQVSLHTTIWSVDKGPIGFVWSSLEGGIENLSRKATKWTKYQGHIPVLLSII